jgi:hypothetical protein
MQNNSTIPENDFEVSSLDAMCINDEQVQILTLHNLKYLLFGLIFGIVLIKAEVVSWFRIQEMFRLQSFHMFGVIGSGVLLDAISVFIIKKFKIKSIQGEEIILPEKTFNKGQIYGGLLFGFGWAMTGACPGPLFAQLGYGAATISVTILMAIVGTWVYGKLREKLPH